MDTTMKKIFVAAGILPAAASVMLIGCMVGPKYHTPAATTGTTTPPPAMYKEAPAPAGTATTPDATMTAPPNIPSDANANGARPGSSARAGYVPLPPGSGKTPMPQGEPAKGWKPAQPGDAMLKGKWWQIYNDTELNALEDQVDINNQNIKQAFENFMEARALIAEARSQLYPTVSVGPSYQRSRTSQNLKNTVSSTGGIAVTGEQSTLMSLPLDVSWTPDLWGKIRSQIHEEQYTAQVSEADLENERLTEQATLAYTFFEIRGQDALIDLYRATVKADADALSLAKARYETGVDDKISLVQAQNTLDNVTAQLTNLGVARAQYEHAIAMLIGSVASNFSIPPRALDAQPPAVPLGVPSQLLERRPDIAAAERTMAAANAQIGIAYAAYYPELTLSAGGGFESSTFTHLLDWGSRFWSLGGTVNETVFDAGLRRATVHQYVAAYNADVASYRQTVLTAFQQVEDYLASERILSDQMVVQQRAAGSAAEALNLEMARYETGIDPYVDVVTAQTTLLSDQQAVANLRTQQMTSSVQLVEALGGGWDLSQLPTPAQVSEKPSKAATSVQ